MLTRLFAAAAIAAALACATAAQSDGRDADRAQIMTEIGRITQAFIDGDLETVYKTHSQDWSGFLNDDQTEPISGIDAYMRGNGIVWPLPKNYKRPGPNPFPDLHYKISNFVCNFVTPDVGVASFTLDYPWRDGVHFNRLRIMDVFAKRDGRWIQTASYTVLDPHWKAEQAAMPAAIGDGARQRILQAREAVWRAWFAGDTQKLEAMIPAEAVAINGASKDWETRDAILTGARQFAASGGKLTRLEFPRTEMQVYGSTIILFTSYSFDTEQGGKRRTVTGNGVETFVRRGDAIVNTGWILADAP
jgi:hypothetical protein